MMINSKKKIFIIGLDGGIWDVFNPLMKKGVMPTLKKICEKGIKGILKSTIPPTTPVAWSSFQTGVNPGKHGVTGFITLYKNGRVSLVNASSIQTETIWDLMNKANKKVILINVPMTYPPKKNKGVIITGIMTPSKKSRFTYPPELIQEIEEALGEYIIFPNEKREGDYTHEKQLKKFVDAIIKVIKKRTKTALYLMDKYDWDVFMVHFQCLDLIQHFLWHHAQGVFGEKKRSQVLRFYKELDNQINILQKHLSNYSNVFKVIISDHGFQEHKKDFYINKWLYDQGYLKLPEKNFLERITGYLLPKLFLFEKSWLTQSIDFLNLRKKIFPQPLRNMIKRKYKQDLMVDMKKSKAFAQAGSFYGTVYINASGENYHQQRKALIKKIQSIKDPEDNKKVAERCYKGEELYWGIPPYLRIPDIIVKPTPGYEFVASIVKTPLLFKKIRPEKERSGTHHQDGIFVLEGKMVNKSLNLKTINIIDLPPTFLYFLDIPVPEYIDGKIFKKIFKY